MSFFAIKKRGKFYFSKVIIFLVFSLLECLPICQVLVLGQSFVKTLHADLERGFHPQARSDVDLVHSAHVILFDHGGRTVLTLWSYDLHAVSLSPSDIIILEISTNGRSAEEPSFVAASIEVFGSFSP